MHACAYACTHVCVYECVGVCVCLFMYVCVVGSFRSCKVVAFYERCMSLRGKRCLVVLYHCGLSCDAVKELRCGLVGPWSFRIAVFFLGLWVLYSSCGVLKGVPCGLLVLWPFRIVACTPCLGVLRVCRCPCDVWWSLWSCKCVAFL